MKCFHCPTTYFTKQLRRLNDTQSICKSCFLYLKRSEGQLYSGEGYRVVNYYFPNSPKDICKRFEWKELEIVRE